MSNTRIVTPATIEVEVGGSRLAYQWRGSAELKIGDKVKTPPPYWLPSDHYRIGTVVRFGSDYTGSLVSISQIVSPE